jgi:hypothetical protein
LNFASQKRLTVEAFLEGFRRFRPWGSWSRSSSVDPAPVLQMLFYDSNPEKKCSITPNIIFLPGADVMIFYDVML